MSSESVITALTAAVSANNILTDSKKIAVLYAQDYSHFNNFPSPLCVLFPTCEDHVVALVQVCAKMDVAIIGYGSGTSLEGHIAVMKAAKKYSVTVSFERMARLLTVNATDMDCVVQPGISFAQLNKQLKSYGLYFPLDAGPQATIGGMTMTSASGTKAVRYGTMKENVLGLRVVLADGRIVKTSNRARKSVAGYDLTHLFVGSEGTLGLCTQITVRLYRLPLHDAAALIPFPVLANAADAVIALMQAEVPLVMVELMDSLMIKAMNRASRDASYPERDTLYIQMSAMTEQALQLIVDQVRDIVTKHHAEAPVFVSAEKDRDILWKRRKSCLMASRKLLPAKSKHMVEDPIVIWTTDVCVPISKLGAVLVETQADLKRSNVVAPLVAHAGDGNFHLFIVYDGSDKVEVQKARDVNTRLLQRAIRMHGTCTGEHGIGFGKSHFLDAELGHVAVDVMRKLKRTMDPMNILNPGKVLPVARM